MFERVIGSPVRGCCHALDTAEFRSKVKTLPMTLTPAAVARLDHAATEFFASTTCPTSRCGGNRTLTCSPAAGCAPPPVKHREGTLSV